ncbi:KEOPS complex subunit Cgi121 [Candidatus Nitrosocaldus islandicus]|jgi:tRNA threonylcarbamoyladenosine modification (KEOPS) complex Cgi121 subunit|nr:KEOPS complex subunit Cgi121 [Candidatus Nitrosocaldus islandicus]
MVVAYSMILRLINDEYVYHVMLIYITVDLSLEEPEEFVRRLRALATEEKENGIIVQVVDADSIAGRDHLLEVLAQSLEAERRSCMLAKRVEVDMILRLACTRQISDAIERVGLKKESGKALLVAVVREEDAYDSRSMKEDDVGGEDDGRRKGEEWKEEKNDDSSSYYYNLLISFKDRLKAVDGVKRVYDDEVEVGLRGEGEEKEKEEKEEKKSTVYEHLASIHGISEQELTSCISSNKLVSILAERANLLHR